MSLKCLVFDCDGVILESVAIKTKAYARLTEPYGKEARDLMVMYHTVHGGVSRYKKFEWFFNEVLEREITATEAKEWGEKFVKIAFEEVCRCELVPGIKKVFDTYKDVLPMYVCSGAPQDELIVILKGRGLEHYFDAIYGSPPAKDILLQKIVNEAKVEPEQVLMVGDTITDLNAAESVGTMFYGRGNGVMGCSSGWGEDLVELSDWIEQKMS